LSELARAGKIDAASVKNVAKVAIGVAVKSGAAQPPIATVEEFKQAVLQAKKVAYIDPASGGSSGIYLDGLFKRLGISEEVKSKAVLVPGGYAAERVANGEADLAIHQVSEIMPVKGVVLVGLLPAEIQNFTTYGFGISTESKNQALAKKFVGSIAGAGGADMIRSKGMERILE
jgi:molybdate transport system substrate-binding protein